MAQQSPEGQHSPDEQHSPDDQHSPGDQPGPGPPAVAIDGETRLHGRRVLAAARTGARVEIHLLAASGERVDPFADLAVAEGVVGRGARAVLPGAPGAPSPSVRLVPAPVGPLPQVFVFTFATPDDAAAELVVVDHWGRHGILVEAWTSGLDQAAVLWDPATGVTTGVRLPLGT